MATRRSFDDSDEEEEATAIDLRSNSAAFRKATSKPSTSSPPSQKSPSSASQPSKPAPPPSASSSLHDSSDEEATEFLSERPSSVRSAVSDLPGASSQQQGTASQMRARGRAIPLEKQQEQQAPPTTAPPVSVIIARESTEPVTSPEMVASLPARTPRPLPERIISDLKSETQTGSSGGGSGKSAPRITRIFVDPNAPQTGGVQTGTHKKITPEEAASETDPGDEATDPPAPARPLPRPLPAPGKPPTIVAVTMSPNAAAAPVDEKAAALSTKPHRAKTARTPSEPTSETLEAEPADGTLIVEVPDGAVVFVDGLERGKGPSLKVKEIDRYAKHAVRIHAPGYLPWSGSVCLEGRTAAKIRPGLKKRDGK